MLTGPVKILYNRGRASPRLNVYIKKIKKLYGPTSLHLEPSNVFIQQVEWGGAARILAKGEEPFCLPPLVGVLLFVRVSRVSLQNNFFFI